LHSIKNLKKALAPQRCTAGGLAAPSTRCHKTIEPVVKPGLKPFSRRVEPIKPMGHRRKMM